MTLKFFAAAIFITIFLMLVLGNFALYQAEIACPHIFTTTPADVVTYLLSLVVVLLSPCSGLPFWVYILVFMPLVAAIIVFLTPLIG